MGGVWLEDVDEDEGAKSSSFSSGEVKRTAWGDKGFVD